MLFSMPQPVNVIPTKSAIVFAQAQEAERKALQAFFDGQSAECCSLLNSAVSYARQLNSDVEDPAIAEGLVRVYLNRCLYYFVSTAIDRLTDADWQGLRCSLLTHKNTCQGFFLSFFSCEESCPERFVSFERCNQCVVGYLVKNVMFFRVKLLYHRSL